MATPNEKLAASLDELAFVQKGGRRVFRSNEFSRTHRERLLKAGFLQEVTRGWLIGVDPGVRAGDSTSWFATIWEFCAAYCEERFGSDWHLAPEQSLLLHAENTIVPAQLIVFSTIGTNSSLPLPFGTSLYSLKERTAVPESDTVIRERLRIFSMEAALIKAPEAFYVRSPVEAQICLASLRSPSALLGRLLQGGNSVVAGRLAGAFRHIGRVDFAEEIVAGMRSADYKVVESDPFDESHLHTVQSRGVPPIVIRLRAMWEKSREAVLAEFPPAPGRPDDPGAYLDAVDDVYVNDAYHSLSIEGYRVSPELIERVRSGAWDPRDDGADRKNLDALAARGYWQAFTRVKRTVADVLKGGNAAELAEKEIQAWYREMFQPCVQAGILSASAMAGFRVHPVYLRASRFVPPRSELVPDAMSCLFDLLKGEAEPSVQAVLGHWLLGYIHPFPDGNGRTARFLMNTMLAAGGYPWTIIRKETRHDYLAALDKASIDGDIRPFARFVAESVAWSKENGFQPPASASRSRLIEK